MLDMTKGSTAKLILVFTIPMFIGSVFQQLYNVVDRMIVGQFIGEKALAAVGASFSVIFLLIALAMGATMGVSVLVSQYYGAKNYKRVRLCIETSYLFMTVISLALMAVGLLCNDFILRLLNTPPEILADAELYLNTLFAGMIFFFGYNLISAILRGLGDSNTPLYLLIISTLVNIALDLIFVIYFHWGVFGAAFATVISWGVSFIGGIYYLHRINRLFRVNYFRLRFAREIFARSMQIGLPSGVQQMLVAAGMMVLHRLVNGFGTSALAAFTAAGSIDAFAMMPAMNLSMAMSTFVGQNIGAGRRDRVRGAVKAGLVMSALIATGVSLLVVGCGKWLLLIFTAEPLVLSMGQDYLRIVGSFYLPFMLMFIYTGCLRGAGDTFIPTLLTVLSLWIIRVPAASFLSAVIGLNGVWWSMPISWGLGLILTAAYFYSGVWEKEITLGKKQARAEI
ncbi:MATE family efflux transporter [Candidatus Termititenax persephonae]|uniref:Probable multidrug resistance protein NorM n=1 Tax=Candidatus Termititenax persephonae TaxID=2218525 RepID=A0A388TGB4_9BACT|nr:MATE family efflux transporter [Candidatus Termititenax persephonae]